MSYADHMAQLRCLRMWLEAAQPWIDSMQQQTKRQADQQHKMHQMVTAARALDRGDRYVYVCVRVCVCVCAVCTTLHSV